MLPDLEANGIALFAISYDSVEILRGFADKHDIRFPLLSDEGSRVIRQLGLINERVQEDHAVYGIKPNPRHVDLPYPGVFVLDEDGIIVHKRFHESYRERRILSARGDRPWISAADLRRATRRRRSHRGARRALPGLRSVRLSTTGLGQTEFARTRSCPRRPHATRGVVQDLASVDHA